jgi:hypothetical protein
MPPPETPPPPENRVGEYFTSGLFCLQRKHLACKYYITFCFLQGGFVSTSPNLQAGGPHPFCSPRLLIQCIRSCPPYWRPFLQPQPEDAPCRGDRDPQTRVDPLQKTKLLQLCNVIIAQNYFMFLPLTTYKTVDWQWGHWPHPFFQKVIYSI